jgi:integrase
VSTTLDIYSHVTPGLQEAAAKRFDDILTTKYNTHGKEATEKMR